MKRYCSSRGIIKMRRRRSDGDEQTDRKGKVQVNLKGNPFSSSMHHNPFFRGSSSSSRSAHHASTLDSLGTLYEMRREGRKPFPHTMKRGTPTVHSHPAALHLLHTPSFDPIHFTKMRRDFYTFFKYTNTPTFLYAYPRFPRDDFSDLEKKKKAFVLILSVPISRSIFLQEYAHNSFWVKQLYGLFVLPHCGRRGGTLE